MSYDVSFENSRPRVAAASAEQVTAKDHAQKKAPTEEQKKITAIAMAKMPKESKPSLGSNNALHELHTQAQLVQKHVQDQFFDGEQIPNSDNPEKAAANSFAEPPLSTNLDAEDDALALQFLENQLSEIKGDRVSLKDIQATRDEKISRLSSCIYNRTRADTLETLTITAALSQKQVSSSTIKEKKQAQMAQLQEVAAHIEHEFSECNFHDLLDKLGFQIKDSFFNSIGKEHSHNNFKEVRNNQHMLQILQQKLASLSQSGSDDSQVLQRIDFEKKEAIYLVPPHLKDKYHSDHVMIDGERFKLTTHIMNDQQHEDLKNAIEEHLALLNEMFLELHAPKTEDKHLHTSDTSKPNETASLRRASHDIKPKAAIAILKKLLAAGNSLDRIHEAARKWDEKMLKAFIEQIEKEFLIKKTEIMKALDKQEAHSHEIALEEKNQKELRRPENLSMLEELVFKLYLLSNSQKGS